MCEQRFEAKIIFTNEHDFEVRGAKYLSEYNVQKLIEFKLSDGSYQKVEVVEVKAIY